MFTNIFTNQMEKALFDSLNSSIENIGYRVIKIIANGMPKAGSSDIKIIIDTLDRHSSICIDDCEKVSKHVSVLLGVHDLVPDNEHYNLEVSSPGIDKPLTTTEDLLFHIRQMVNVTVICPVLGHNSISGVLEEVHEEKIALGVDVTTLSKHQQMHHKSPKYTKRLDDTVKIIQQDKRNNSTECPIGHDYDYTDHKIYITFNNIKDIHLKYNLEKLFRTNRA